MSAWSLACQQSVFRRYHSENIYQSFTHKMTAKASWHWNYVTVILYIVCSVQKSCQLTADRIFSDSCYLFTYSYNKKVKVKVAHTRLPSVGFRGWSLFLAVNPQVTWVINPAVGYHYFPRGLQLPLRPLRGLLPISLLGEQRHDGFEQFASWLSPVH